MDNDIKSLSADQLREHLMSWKEPAYRLQQILEWLYVHQAERFDEMSNVPAGLRRRLGEAFSLNVIQPVRVQGARDTTQKFLWRLPDGALIESVLIPANPALYGERSDRHTLCISTQVGCAFGCRFCASGLDGWKRNLEPFEIVEQVLAVERWHRDQSSGQPSESRRVNNIVVMGMGEPLANYDHLMQALRILNAPWGGSMGARKITVSTSGLAPQIRRLADEPEQFRLAVSLHGSTDAVRSKIMPVNRKYPLRALTEALDYYQSSKDRLITFEYILIAGINDDASQVRPLAELARRLNAKVNLIPYNLVEGLPWERPADSVCEEFASSLESQGVKTTLRLEKGHDIDAACGQLRLKTEKEMATVMKQ